MEAIMKDYNEALNNRNKQNPISSVDEWRCIRKKMNPQGVYGNILQDLKDNSNKKDNDNNNNEEIKMDFGDYNFGN